MIPSRTLRRPVAAVALALLGSAFLTLYAIGWIGDVHLAVPSALRWPTSSILSPTQPPIDLGTAIDIPPAMPAPEPTGPPISIIIIWKNAGQPYIPNFVQSVLSNRPNLEVLWVGVCWAHEETCFDPLEGHEGEGANLKLLCLSEDEYWEMHRDYFCERWGCSPGERKDVLDRMIERQQQDYQHSFFRLWRGYVFRKYLNPDARWWGWADPDTFLGNFDTQFPWDAESFDVFIPASEHTLLYLRGHLAFFRTGVEVEEKLGKYPNLLSAQAYLERHIAGQYTAMEEAEFSAFIIRNPDISFLLAASSLVEIPLGEVALNTPTFATLNGTYMPYTIPSSLPDFPNIPVLGLPGQCPSCPPMPERRATFSEKGVTRPVRVREGEYAGALWFAKEYATEYVPPRRLRQEKGWTVFVGRGGPFATGGGIWERLEPPPQPIHVPVLSSSLSAAAGSPKVEETYDLREGLYIHWFHQKYGSWFPGPTLDGGKTLMSVFKDGAEVWGNGEVVWRSRSTDAG